MRLTPGSQLIVAALALLTLLAWAYLYHLAVAMAAMPGMAGMPGMAMAAATPGSLAWTAADFVSAWLMWSVMMVGMMAPSATPTILTHAAVGRDAVRRGRAWSPTAWFAAGYFFAWAGFSGIAAAAQGLLQRVAWLTPMLAPARPALAGLLLIAAGAYQLTPAKAACLTHCRAPLHFIQQHGGFRADPGGALRLGLRHGLYCIGCCWALMALLFAGGVMNLVWVAGIAVFVLIEKATPAGAVVARIAGIAFAASGCWLLFRA